MSIKQYNTNISIYTKQKCWRALQSLQDNYSMHSIWLHRLTWNHWEPLPWIEMEVTCWLVDRCLWSCTRFSVLEGVSRMNFYFCWDYRMRTLGIAAISRMDFGFPSLKKMELCYKSQLRFKFCWVFCCCCFFSSQIIKF